MFELDLVSSACLGSYRSTLHRPSPLFRNIYSAAITARWTLEFQFIEFEESLDASRSFKLRVDISRFRDQDREFRGKMLQCVVRLSSYCDLWKLLLCENGQKTSIRTVSQLIYGRYTIIIVCYVQRIDIFVFFSGNMSRCSLIHFHEFFYKDKIYIPVYRGTIL